MKAYIANTHTGKPVLVVGKRELAIPLMALDDESLVGLINGAGNLAASAAAHLGTRLRVAQGLLAAEEGKRQ